MTSPKGDIYTNKPQGKSVIEEKKIFFCIFTMPVPKQVKKECYVIHLKMRECLSFTIIFFIATDYFIIYIIICNTM